jgi:hypothetical protein
VHGPHNWHTDLQVGEDNHEGQETKGDVPWSDVVLIVIIMIVLMVMVSARKAPYPYQCYKFIEQLFKKPKA